MCRLSRRAFAIVAISLMVVPAGGQEAVGPSLELVPETFERVSRVESSPMLVSAWAAEDGPTHKTVTEQTIRLLQSKLEEEKGDLPEQLQVDIEGIDVHQLGNKWTVLCPLRYQGIPLGDRTHISGVITADGERAVFRQRNIPKTVDIPVTESGNPQPALSVQDAQVVAIRKLEQLADARKARFDSRTFSANNAQLEIWVDPESQKGLLAWAFDLEETEKKSGPVEQAYRVWVTATGPQPPRVVEIRELVHHSHTGIIHGPIWSPTPASGPKTVPIANATVHRRRPNGSGHSEDETQTDNAGKFAFGVGDGPAELSVHLRSKSFEVLNATGGQVHLAHSTQNSDPVTLSFPSAVDLEIAQVSAFHWAHQARNFVQSIIGPNELVGVKVFVNVDGECNAFWSSSENCIRLFRASVPPSTNNCINRAYRDTIFHEFGHGVDFAEGKILDSSYSEGFGDSLAILFKREACYGSDCKGAGTCLRDASEIVAWPSSDSGTHRRGQIYSGFTWQFVNELQKSLNADQAYATATRLTLEAAARNPTSIENAIALIIEQDDDDLDLSNGTPHFTAIKAAAESRNIPLP